MERIPCVYILASRPHGTLYIGVSSTLFSRLEQHRDELVPGFTRTHNVKRLVWYEVHSTMESAIRKEKALKKWNRLWKIRLIEKNNPDWMDLTDEIC